MAEGTEFASLRLSQLHRLHSAPLDSIRSVGPFHPSFALLSVFPFPVNPEVA